MKKIIFAMIMLFSSNLFASSDHYSFAYIPISDPQEAGEIKLHKAIFFTYNAEPDFSLSAVAMPYIVNTPHSSSSKHNPYNNLDINLANVPGLEIHLSKLYEKKCSVGIDVTKVKVRAPDVKNAPGNSHTRASLDYLLKHVVKATQLNLELHNLKCQVDVIK